MWPYRVASGETSHLLDNDVTRYVQASKDKCWLSIGTRVERRSDWDDAVKTGLSLLVL